MVVPARDEEEHVGAAIDALAAQLGLEAERWELLLVLDPCADATERRALAAAARSSLRMHVLRGPGRGSGGARATGMDAACRRLHAVGRPHGLIASTDADSRVAPDWLAHQLAIARAGAEAIGGRIELAAHERDRLHPAVRDGHAALAVRRFDRVRAEAAAFVPREPGGRRPLAEHWQFSGASMAVTAEVYARVGGLGDHLHSEDEQLERALAEHGIPIERHLAVRVSTSARLEGRSARGLALTLRQLAPEPPEPPEPTTMPAVRARGG